MLSTEMSVHWEPSQFYQSQEAFMTIMSTALRVTIASFCSFSASQTFDVWAFHKLKEKTNGKMLWLRNNLSTIGSQIIDTTIFYVIAFAGILPTEALLKLILVTYILKISIAVIDTPFVYMVTSFVRRGKEEVFKK
jgi:uncharacterized integral membrane protein (TIGR00697 family)